MNTFKILDEQSICNLNEDCANIYSVVPQVRNFINNMMLKERRRYFMYKFIDFMSIKGRQDLRDICKKQNMTLFDLF